MSSSRLQVGIDFGQKLADMCLLGEDGQVLELHRAFSNSLPGYRQARDWWLQNLESHHLDGLDISAEATSLYWLPFFLELEHDPQLAAFAPCLYLLNPRMVSWFKKSLPRQDKSDQVDPYFIAERTRTRRPSYSWSSQSSWLPLRFYTRLRFHLSGSLSGHKNLAHVYLFLLYSRYPSLKPFSDLFGVSSRQVLNAPLSLEEWLEQPEQDLLDQLAAWSRAHLPDPLKNLRKLRQVAGESFQLQEPLAQALQAGLKLLLETVALLEAQIQQVDQFIQTEAGQHPEVANLDSIPGVGPVFAAGIAAEIGDLQRFWQGQKWDKKHKRYQPKNLRDVEDALARFAGLWWPQSSSGDFRAEDLHLAKNGNKYLRYYLVEAADNMRLHIPAYTTYYARKYREVPKHKHKRALVLTARKSIGLMVGLLHRHELFAQEAEQA